MKVKFKVGDKIRIRKWEDMEKEFDSSYGSILCKCSFVSGMRKLCGRTAVISQILEDGEVKLDSWSNDLETIAWEYSTDMLELVECTEEITINRYKNKVVARQGSKVGVARCCPDDEFDLYTGSKLALDRLFGKEEKEVHEVHRTARVGEWIKIVAADVSLGDYKNGDILIVEAVDNDDGYTHAVEVSTGMSPDEYVVLENYNSPKKEVKKEEKLLNGKFVCVHTDDAGITAGKIYEFKNGLSEWDDGTVLPNPDGDDKRKDPIKDTNDLNKYLGDSKMIPLVED